MEYTITAPALSIYPEHGIVLFQRPLYLFCHFLQPTGLVQVVEVRQAPCPFLFIKERGHNLAAYSFCSLLGHYCLFNARKLHSKEKGEWQATPRMFETY